MTEKQRFLPGQGGSFACVNSGKGFVSYFREILEGYDYLYVLKGGPGTGKSHLMKRLMRAGKEREIPAVPIFCSSDPDSLDGILFPTKRTAVIDGTAPHSAEPEVPGITGELIDPGACWDGEALRNQKEEILRRNAEKKKLWSAVYRLLNAAGAVRETAARSVFGELDEKKTARAVSRLVPQGKKAAQGVVLLLPMTCRSMKGCRTLDTQLSCADKIVTIPPLHGAEVLFLNECLRAAKARGSDCAVSPDPATLLPESLYFAGEGLLLRAGIPLERENEKVLPLRRLLPAGNVEERAALRSMTKQVGTLYALADRYFDKLKKEHFALESIYGQAMDFSGLDEIFEKLEKKLFP